MAHIHDHSSHHHDHAAMSHADHVMPTEQSMHNMMTAATTSMPSTSPNSMPAGNHHMHGMHMTFWFGYEIGDFLFSGLIVDSVGRMVATCLLMMALGIFFEILKVQSSKTKFLALKERQQQVHSTNSTTPLVGPAGPSLMSGLPTVATKKTAALALLKNAAFFVTQTLLGYFLMLAVMMYNAFIFLSVVGGMFIGHLLFGHLTLKYNVESVRAVQTEIARSKSCPSEASTTSTLQSHSGLQHSSYGSGPGGMTNTTVIS